MTSSSSIAAVAAVTLVYSFAGDLVAQQSRLREYVSTGTYTTQLQSLLIKLAQPVDLSLGVAVLTRAVRITERSQSRAGGWLYTPNQDGDEGSITVKVNFAAGTREVS